jgi:hypothetical protein
MPVNEPAVVQLDAVRRNVAVRATLDTPTQWGCPRRRPHSASWFEHLDRQARRYLHIARYALHAGDQVLALGSLAIAVEQLETIGRVKAGAA